MWLKYQWFNYLQTIQIYICAICNNVSGNKMQTQEPIGCRQIFHSFYCNIRNGMCPVFGISDTIFVRGIRIEI